MLVTDFDQSLTFCFKHKVMNLNFMDLFGVNSNNKT